MEKSKQGKPKGLKLKHGVVPLGTASLRFHQTTCLRHLIDGISFKRKMSSVVKIMFFLFPNRNGPHCIHAASHLLIQSENLLQQATHLQFASFEHSDHKGPKGSDQKGDFSIR